MACAGAQAIFESININLVNVSYIWNCIKKKIIEEIQ